MVWVVVLLGVALLAGVALYAEWWVREHGVQQAVDRIAHVLDADTELHVVGRPLAWHAIRRELPQVVVVAEDVPVLDGRASLDRVRVELDTVRLEGRGPDTRRVTAGAGRFHLEVSTPQLLALVTLPSYLVSFEVEPSGLRLQTLAGVVVDASVQLERDSLLVRPVSSMLRLVPPPQFRLPLPTWPYGAALEGMRLHAGRVEAWGTLAPEHLAFPAVVDPTRPADDPRAVV